MASKYVISHVINFTPILIYRYAVKVKTFAIRTIPYGTVQRLVVSRVHHWSSLSLCPVNVPRNQSMGCDIYGKKRLANTNKLVFTVEKILIYLLHLTFVIFRIKTVFLFLINLELCRRNLPTENLHSNHNGSYCYI